MFQKPSTLETHHVYSRLKRRENDRFHVASTWNTRGVFEEKLLVYYTVRNGSQKKKKNYCIWTYLENANNFVDIFCINP